MQANKKADNLPAKINLQKSSAKKSQRFRVKTQRRTSFLA